MRLPKLPYAIQKNKQEMIAMRGINYSDGLTDGDLAESTNLSARRYPYISARNGRVQQEDYEGATALTAWDKLIAVEGTSLLYDGEPVGTVSAGEKQFVVVNTKLVIWPDKKYLDLPTLQVKDLGAKTEGLSVTFTTDTMTVISSDGEDPAPDLTEFFRKGDAIEISGCEEATGNNKSIVIQELTETTLKVTANGFTATEEGATETVTIERKIPDMDYICVSENRLWGCSSEAQTIYASAQGDPTNFYVYEGLSTDSFAVAVGSVGDFTGCCALSSSVLFWKETVLHKMLGSYPAEYQLYTYNIEGLQKGCAKSLQVINEVLFYMGIHGVYAYTGGSPALISSNFGNKIFTDAVAGTDGDSYYLSCLEGETPHLLVYETRAGIWVHEDALRVKDFARIGKDLYFLDEDGDVWLADSGADDPDVEWSAQFTPFYETLAGKKIYSRIIIRTELPEGSFLSAAIRYDGDLWREAGRMLGSRNNISTLRLPINRCDKFELRLEGCGPMAILGILREFAIGSDV